MAIKAHHGGEDQREAGFHRTGAAGGYQEALPWGYGQGEGQGS